VVENSKSIKENSQSRLCAGSLFLSNMAGRIVPEISNPEIGELIIRNYRVAYRVKD
jgi:hypothetical protein